MIVLGADTHKRSHTIAAIATGTGASCSASGPSRSADAAWARCSGGAQRR
jgi:hypothetical protein